ncbi:MAG TPA: hypothetical protein VLH40_06320 [Atribacteraceae bacterium]|nr:hypothetical protein [Atribacteraceae bacterium]
MFLKAHRQCGTVKTHLVPEAESAFKPHPAEANSMQCSFIGVSETANRREMLLNKIFAVVSEDKFIILYFDFRFRGSGIIGILQELRKHMPGTLHLLEKLPPWASKGFIRL